MTRMRLRPAAPMWVSAESLNVAPALLGLPLASPRKRAAAMAIDLTLIAILANLSNGGLLLGLSLAWWLELRRRRGQKLTPRRTAMLWIVVALLLVLGVHEAWQSRDPAPRQRVARVAEPEAPEAAEAVEQLKARIARLESQLAAARRAPPLDPRDWLRRAADEIGLGYGWALVYFSLLPVAWPGQTVGKRLLGLQVRELTGRELTMTLNLKRYGGYAAGMATFGWGFLQLLWDHNRQAIQDKATHTVVVDCRGERAA
jgi:hypothetical protein